MKLVLVLTVVCLGSAWAHPGWLSSISSKVSDSTNFMQQQAVNAAKATSNSALSAAKATTNTAVNAAKATTNTAVNAAKATTNTAVYAAKATTNTAVYAAKATTNMTVNAAKAGVNMVKDISMAGINMGISFLIKGVKAIVKKTGYNVLSIPEIHHQTGPIHFSATQGYFKDITTLGQSGSPNVTTNGTTINIDFPIHLSEIDVGYEQFNVTFWKMNIGGGIRILVGNNTFIVHLSLHPGLTCALNVEKVEVAVFEGIEIDFTKFGATSEWILETSSNLIVGILKDQIKSKVQNAIDDAIKDALKEDSTICSKFMG